MSTRIYTFTMMCMVLAVIIGCVGSPVQTSMRASQNKKAMVNVRQDMAPEEVVKLMGQPDKTELYRGKNNEAILIYLYITEGKDSYTRTWNESNYTPFIFIGNSLHSWGWNQLDGVAQKYELVIKQR